MFVIFHFSDDSQPGEILYIYSAKTDLDVLRKRYQSFMDSDQKKPSSKSFIEQLVDEEMIVLTKVWRSPLSDLDPDDMEYYRQVQESQPLTVI
jgi:hypothetical protein